MKQAGGGRLSTYGIGYGFRAPLKWRAPYNAAKAAVHNITRTMAAACGEYHINVNAVIPGSVMNEGLRGMVYDTDDKARSMIEHIPLGRTGEGLTILQMRYAFCVRRMRITLRAACSMWTADGPPPIRRKVSPRIKGTAAWNIMRQSFYKINSYCHVWVRINTHFPSPFYTSLPINGFF